jgi:hypothetical protein
MNINAIKKIEQELAVKLPSAYFDALLNYPFVECSGGTNWSLWDNAEAIVEYTKKYRSGYGRVPAWSNEYICIGDDDACPYALNVLDSSVIKADHGNLIRPALELFTSFEKFMVVLLQDFND